VFGEQELFEIGEVKNGLAFSIPFFLVLPISVWVLLYRPLIKRAKDISPKIAISPKWYVRWFYISLLIFLITAGVCLLNLHLGNMPELKALYVLVVSFIATLAFFVQLYCRRGTAGKNKHGEDPLQ